MNKKNLHYEIVGLIDYDQIIIKITYIDIMIIYNNYLLTIQLHNKLNNN